MQNAKCLKMLFELVSCATTAERRGRRGRRFSGRRVNNLLCSGRLKLVPLTPAISGQIAERTSSSVKTRLVESQISHYRAITSASYKRSLHCVRVNSHSFVPALLKMLPFSCGAPSLFSRPRCLVKINYSFPFILFNCLAVRLDLSQIRGSNIEIFVITGFLLCQKGKINQRWEGKVERMRQKVKGTGKCSLILNVCLFSLTLKKLIMSCC